LKFDFDLISLKNYNLAKLRNFSSPKFKTMGRFKAIFENLLLR